MNNFDFKRFEVGKFVKIDKFVRALINVLQVRVVLAVQGKVSINNFDFKRFEVGKFVKIAREQFRTIQISHTI